MNADKIMCIEDFEKCFNVRIAEKCCASCEYGECDCDGCATCSHPRRNDGGYLYEEEEPKVYTYNTIQSNVCDLWEAKK